MSDAAALLRVDYQHWWEIARGVRHLADTLNLVETSIRASKASRTAPRDRADAQHVLAVHIPALYEEARLLAKAAERLVHAELVADIEGRNAQAADA